MFPFHLFSYSPNPRYRIYVLTHRNTIEFARIMDYKTHKFSDCNSGIKFLKIVAHAYRLIGDGLLPIANFRNIPIDDKHVYHPEQIMPYFRGER